RCGSWRTVVHDLGTSSCESRIKDHENGSQVVVLTVTGLAASPGIKEHRQQSLIPAECVGVRGGRVQPLAIFANFSEAHDPWPRVRVFYPETAIPVRVSYGYIARCARP